jgi:hypothetical protein
MGTIWIHDDYEDKLEKQKAKGQSWTGFLKEKLEETEKEA